MRRSALALASMVAGVTSAQTAHADGLFYQQSYGVSSARGDGASMIGESLYLRLAGGWRWGHLQVGPWIANHLAVQRDGAFYGLLGGEPTAGDSDLQTIGLDGKYAAPFTSYLSAYVRGGPRYARGERGVLEPYQGMGLGLGTGIALTGKVRALGFLAVPLFFAKKGPKITASVFADFNVDWFQMRGDRMRDVWMPLVGTSIGVGAGSFF
jgi:hypothetical protein